MELFATSKDGKSIAYNESFTGKVSLKVDGVELVKTGKKVFKLDTEEGQILYTIKGSFLSGVTIYLSTGENIVLAKNQWYDWVLMFLPMAGIIFAVILCGMLGGFLSIFFCTIAMVINAMMTRSKLPVAARIVLEIVIGIIANVIWFGIWFIIAVILLAALSTL